MCAPTNPAPVLIPNGVRILWGTPVKPRWVTVRPAWLVGSHLAVTPKYRTGPNDLPDWHVTHVPTGRKVNAPWAFSLLREQAIEWAQVLLEHLGDAGWDGDFTAVRQRLLRLSETSEKLRTWRPSDGKARVDVSPIRLLDLNP